MLSELKTGTLVELGDGSTAMIMRKKKSKSIFKEVFPWVVSFVKLGTTNVQVKSLKEDGTDFRLVDGSLSEFSIVRIK